MSIIAQARRSPIDQAHFEDMPEVRDWVWTDEAKPPDQVF